MLKLKHVNTSPPGGFCFVDKATGFSAHGWSFKSVASQWYNELLRRGKDANLDKCKDEVEQYTCNQVMNSHNWEEWVFVVGPPNNPTFSFNFQPRDATVLVIIPVYKPNQERLTKCIGSVKDQASEVILVHEGTEENNPDKRIKYLLSGPVGFGSKCNIGAAKSSSEYLWFLNDDCYPSKDCAKHLINILNANSTIGAVGHLLRYPNGRIQHAGTQRVNGSVGFPHRDVGELDTTLKVPTEMEAVTAASMMVRRDAFEAVGGFDEGYFLYLEDSDLCLKLRASGWKVYFTPFAEAVHEEHTSSKTRLDLDSIVADSVKRFTGKWSEYLSKEPPKFQSFEEVSKVLKVDAVYVHLVDNDQHEKYAENFVNSVLKFHPGQPINWVIVCNSPSGRDPSEVMKPLFSKLGTVSYFKHDNSGWDIGAFQAYSRTSKADICLFFGSTAYCRVSNWAEPMIAAFREKGPYAVYGVCGNMGNLAVKVYPHVRTTGFWCSPKLFNNYPTTVTNPTERYPFEHGPQSLTMWSWANGYQVYIVDTDAVWEYPNWNNNPQGFQMGNQRSLLFGDRVTSPPFTANP